MSFFPLMQMLCKHAKGLLHVLFLTLKYFPAPLKVLSETCERVSEFCKPIPYRVAVGTYNVNGGKHFRSLAYKHLSLDDWLLDSQKNEGIHCKF